MPQQSLSEAIDAITKYTHSQAKAESIEITMALGRTLAQDVVADIPQPPFHKSAMDGFACREIDLPGPLELITTVAAGTDYHPSIEAGQCVRIFTGAKIPDGADWVIMQEHAFTGEDGKIHLNNTSPKSNICYEGEDVAKGQCLIARGHRLTAPDLAILASAGCTRPEVYCKPVVGILCTGDELVDAAETPTGSKIRNTNLYQLIGQISAMHATPKYYGMVQDNSQQLKTLCQQAIAECDILITTGGASVGLFDLMPDIFQQLGGTIHLNGVGIQPGKPVIFATIDQKPVWGLSGNPVSSFLQFNLLVKRCISLLSHSANPHPTLRLMLNEDIARKKGERDLFVPIGITPGGKVQPIAFNGSAHIAALSGAWGFAQIPAGTLRIDAGNWIDCYPI